MKGKRTAEKKHILDIRFFIIILIPILLIAASTAKYVIKITESRGIESEDFQFESDIASINGKTTKIENWDTLTEKNIKFNLASYANSLLTTNDIVKYNINLEASTGITVKLFDEAGNEVTGEQEISANSKEKKTYTIKVNSTDTTIQNYTINIKIKTTEPYEKEIVGTIELSALQDEFKANLIDNDSYVTLSIKSDTTTSKVVNYDNSKILLDKYNENVITDITANTFKINIQKDEIYQISFIKINKGDNIVLGTDISI